MEEKVSHKYVGEHSKRQRHLEESGMNMTRLNWAKCVCGKGVGVLGAAARRPKVPKGQVTKMSGLDREGPLRER